MSEPMRADAQQNRDRIISVAFEALTTEPQTSMNAIAKAAGVGPGTLYRHFPTRDDLILAVYRSDLDQVVKAADTLMAKEEPIEALRKWLLRLARYGTTKHGLLEAVRAEAKPSNLGLESRGALQGTIDRLLDACKESGAIKKDITSDDFLLAMNGLFRLDESGDWQSQAKRLIDFLIAGLTSR